MEGLGINVFLHRYNGKRVLVTGHTGFKGSWLVLWLSQLGARIAGCALDPATTPNHWDLLNLQIEDYRFDIRDYTRIAELIDTFKPEIVFHLAAQPLVRRSYRDPLETLTTNIIGTANLLEACRHVQSVESIVCITTDKVYTNKEWIWGYRESDVLGGHDPYSASKACCELIAESYRNAFYAKQGKCLLATVRAGNVIGGGDWSEDRFIPDLVRAATTKTCLEVRSPNATRPWQHVLESLCGYLLVGQHLIERRTEVARPWNIGPNAEDNQQVIEVLEQLSHHWPEVRFRVSDAQRPHEANLLYLDNSLAKSLLHWRPVWSLRQALCETAMWYKSYVANDIVLSIQQLQRFTSDAQALRLTWAVD